MLKTLIALIATMPFALVISSVAAQPNPRVKLTTNLGAIVIELYPDKAPITVKNFLDYVRSQHYEGTIFHRVMAGFMIQGGGFDASLAEKSERKSIKNEADNGLKNTSGTVAMARLPDPHSASAQFFINTVDNPGLDHKGKTDRDWGYAVFGIVIEGMDVVKRIERTPTGRLRGMSDVPTKAITIEKAEIIQ